MNLDTTIVASTDQVPTPTRRPGIPRPMRALALALPITAAISAALVVPGWIGVLPRPVRRELTEALLQSVLCIYAALFCAALIGTVTLGGMLARSRFEGETRSLIVRSFAASVSCAGALFLLEIGSAGWRSWLHRFPALPTHFAASPPDLYRIVVLGESSASGEPYWPWLSVGQIVAWQLSQKVGDRRFECDVVAYPGDSLEMQHHKLADLKRRPDAVIIYSGHNEFAARFEEEREGWQDERPWPGLGRIAHWACVRSPFCRLAYEIISKNRLDRPPSLALRHQLIDPPVCSQVEAAAIQDDFHRRLEAIVTYCDRIGALPILIVPPANESGYEPCRSTISPSVAANDRVRVVAELNEARALEPRDPSASAARMAAIVDQHPGFAEGHFRLARLLEREGRISEAGRHYLAALDNDGLPLRCQAPFRAAILEVAHRHARSILIDGRRELSAISPDGLLGDHVIHDTHHPTLRGYIALADAVVRELDRTRVFDHAVDMTLAVDPAACIAHFGMNAARWADTCDRVSEHYRRVAGYRYDPVERLEKAGRYRTAAQRIRAGLPIDDLCLPGLPPADQFGTANPERAGAPPHPVSNSPPDNGPITPRPASRPRLFNDLLHLPVLQIDHRATTQESDHGHELVSLPATDHFSGYAGQRTGRDADHRADGRSVFFGDRHARTQHHVDLAKVAFDGVLVDDGEHVHQPVGAKGGQAVVRVSFEEDITRKKRNNRLDLSPLRRVTFFEHLRKVIDDPLGEQVACRGLFLPGLGVQAPPDRVWTGRQVRLMIP
jgi:hypothetical protein